MKIYPDVDFFTAQIKDGDQLLYHTKIMTKLRKKHTDGKWYKQTVLNYSAGPTPDSISWCVNEFNWNVYLALQYGIVIPDLKHSTGEFLFELDEDQRSEEERLAVNKLKQ
jgi:hypothetical protein